VRESRVRARGALHGGRVRVPGSLSSGEQRRTRLRQRREDLSVRVRAAAGGLRPRSQVAGVARHILRGLRREIRRGSAKYVSEIIFTLAAESWRLLAALERKRDVPNQF